MTTTASNNSSADLIKRIEAELTAYTRLGSEAISPKNLIDKWQELVGSEPKRFINEDRTVNVPALKNFRRDQIFVPDWPEREMNRPNFRNFIGGQRRGHRRVLNEALEVLEENGCQDLLQKYPCHPAGNPYVYRRHGFSYTFRWSKHIYSLNLFNKIMAEKLGEGFLSLDIGSSYGIFPSLLKREHPTSHHILVDFPEQLILAYYFLGTCIPGATIAGVKEIMEQKTLDRDFFMQYDFCLLPYSLYQDIVPGTLDMVSNFASLGEMSRDWFNYYIKSPTFTTAKYFFTANRIQSYPGYDTDLKIVDYPVWDADKTFHFGISPVFSNVYMYQRKNLFFNERVGYPPYFEYIGEI